MQQMEILVIIDIILIITGVFILCIFYNEYKKCKGLCVKKIKFNET